MTLQRHFKRMRIDVQDGVHLLHIGEMEIWDGADLALLREGLFKLIEHEHCRAIAIDMRFVKYIPSGFFGMAAIRGRDITLWLVTVKSYRLPDAPYLAVHRTCDRSTDSAHHKAWCRMRRQVSWRTRNERGIPSRQ